MDETLYQHWRLSTDADRILWLTLDRKGASVNTLNQEVFTELASILTKLQRDLPVGVIILSGKSKGFIAGADIKQFTAIQTSEQAFDLIRQAQIILEQLHQLPVPTVALIRGFCLGGGLELALACRYRIAEDIPATQLGLPEVKLGLHPGWGGTVRLPQLIGAASALKMMLTGTPVNAKEAMRLGIVDTAVPERYLEKAARYYILRQPSTHTDLTACLSNAAWVRPVLFRVFHQKLRQKVKEEHYPAPYAILRNWERAGAKGEKAMINEAQSIAHLMVGSTSKELVRAFFLQDQLKAFAKNSHFKPKHVHVIGAGAMGGDIAAWCAYKGFTVTLQDQTPEKIAPAVVRAKKLFSKKWGQSRLVQAAMDRFQPDPTGLGVKHADVVIEAVFENLAVKRQVFKDLLPNLKPQALLATNTSSIPLQEIATILEDPKKLIGLHFFNPVAKMMLIEVIGAEQANAEMLANAAGFVNLLNHFPLPVASKPGFLINRILMPYLLEAVLLHEEGVAMGTIDQAAKDFGMPMGPLELADHVGLDICLSVAKHLAPYYHLQIPAKLTTMVSQNHLGVKTGRGFYTYAHGTKKAGQKATSTQVPDLTDRLILRLCNEAVACLAEHVVASADLLDAGMIYGVGFAPFRGGPMEYIRQVGPEIIKEKLTQFSKQYGERFQPVSGWNNGP